MTWITILGFVAAIFTTFSFLPQVIKIWRTKDTSGISQGMYSIFCMGILLWLVYGILIEDWPIILANIITFSLSASVLTMTFLFRKKS